MIAVMPNNNVKRLCVLRAKKYIYVAFALIFLIAMFFGLRMITNNANPYDAVEYNSVSLVNYITTTTDQNYCSYYDECFWMCRISDNKYICPQILANNINSSDCYTKNEIDSYELNNNISDNLYKCCQGGPCIEYKNYWKISCVYQLQNDINSITVTVSNNGSFLTKDLALKSFNCINYTKSLPLYYPITNMELTVLIPSNVSMCPYDSSTCSYTTDIIFDKFNVYNMDSHLYYENYNNSRIHKLILGICLLIFAIVVIPIIYCKMYKECCFKNYCNHEGRVIVPTQDIEINK
jgi:hypothetical protein